MRGVQRRILRVFAVIERPAAWVLLIGAGVTLVSVVIGLLVVGTAKWATILIAASLVVDGFNAVQTAEDKESEDSEEIA